MAADIARCSECNSNVTGERVVCFGCHEAIVADVIAAQAVRFVPCPGYREGQPHMECAKCGGFGAVTAPAAPLEKAVENLRTVLDAHKSQPPGEVGVAALALLAALDADKRLERAEAALREIRDTVNDPREIAARYFAEKGERP